jgi:hypothetical protein
MTTVPVTIAGTDYFQNLVVKNRADFLSGAFFNLTARTLDSDTAVLDTLSVTNLNQMNVVASNPFVGLSLNPNELVALTSTKSLTTVPYSNGDVTNTAIQRTALNGLVTRFVGLFTSSAQLVLGTGNTITLTATQNGYTGSVGLGGHGGIVNMLLSGSASVINESAANNRLVIDDSSTSGPMTIHVLMESGPSQESSYVFTKANTELWRLTLVDSPGFLLRVIFYRLPPIRIPLGRPHNLSMPFI